MLNMILIGKLRINPLHLHSKNLEIMFAVVKIAGQQFKVTAGQSLYVPHLQVKPVIKLNFLKFFCMTMMEKFLLELMQMLK